MNILDFFCKMLYCLSISSVISLLIATGFLSLLLIVVNLLRLLYEDNYYWVLNFSVAVWLFSWFLIYSYLLTIEY